MIKKTIFKNSKGLLISSYHHFPKTESNKGIILCHGMHSNKNGIKVTHFADFFSSIGFHTLRFDFRYVSDANEAKFEEITLSGEVEDLEAGYKYFLHHNINEITLIGSSLGGCVASIFASKNKVNKLVTIAAPFLFEKMLKKWFSDKEFLDYKNKKYAVLSNSKINWDFADDALKIDFNKILPQIKCPVLIIHGENDNVVDIENSNYFHSKTSSKKEFFIIKNGDHRLNDKLDILTEKIKDFIIY